MSCRTFLVLLLCVNIALGANILAVLPLFLKSHAIFTHAIAKELASRGHNVTILTPFPEKNTPGNYYQVVADQDTCWEPDLTDEEREVFLSGKVPFVLSELGRWDSMLWFTELALNSTEVRSFIANDRTKYDLILGELFLQEAFLMMAYKYKAPIVLLSSLDGHSVSESAGSPPLASVIPFEYGRSADIDNVWQRTLNILYSLFDMLGRRYYVLPRQQALAEKYFGHLGPLPKLEDIEKNVSLTLVNTHFSLNSMRPVMPGIVDVAGVHIKPTKELPKNIKEFVENATDGVIYFSIGTIIRSSKFPAKRREALFTAFGELKQRVIWKWDSDTIPSNISSNIMLTNWAPQADLLAHPNTRLFITHGGFLGLTEAVHFGVPILGIPIFGDQFLNIEKAVKLGFGAKLPFEDITVEKLRPKLHEVLTNPKYLEGAKRASRLFRDKPSSAMNTAIYWIEYVLRNEGAVHLRSPLLGLKFYEYLMLDSLVLVVFVLGAVISVNVYLMLVLKSLWDKRSKSKKKDMNGNATKEIIKKKQ